MVAFDPTTRRNGIGASEAAAVLGLSRYKSALDVYIDKTKEDLSPRPETAASKRGKRLEPIVLDMYEDEHGAVLRDVPQMVSMRYPFMFASLDAARADNGCPVEAKTAGRYVAHQWGEPGTDDIPQEYLIQITHQMIVADKTEGDIAALLTLDDFRRYPIMLDQELAGMLVEALANFWKRVENRDAPPPTTGDEVERLHKRSVEAGIEADGAIACYYRDLLETRNAMKPLEKQEADLIDKIKVFMGEKDTLLLGGQPICTWKSAKGSMRFDTKRFQHERPELYASYLTQSEGSRRFTIKEPKK
jgi:putative phage-type endonuclease